MSLGFPPWPKITPSSRTQSGMRHYARSRVSHAKSRFDHSDVVSADGRDIWKAGVWGAWASPITLAARSPLQSRRE